MADGGRRWSSGGFACVDAVIGAPAAKAALGRGGAIAVDMESGPVGRWAEANGVPFISVRAILDSLKCAVPFDAAAPAWRGVLRHPVHTVRLGGRAVVAGRALGAALGDVLTALRKVQR